jgi:predicted DNA-binding transcriptional regulator AlpA
VIPSARPDDEFLTTNQAAAILGRSVKTLEYWRTLPSGPTGPRFYKQGRVVRYLRSDILAWGMRHCVETRDTVGRK